MRPGLGRLLHLREQAEAVGDTMERERGRFAALAREESKPRTVAVPLLFQTPEPLAARMAGLLELGPDDTVLEPSAGLGRLYRATRAIHDGPMILVDVAPDCCRELYEQTREDHNATLRQGDFLELDLPPVDGVIMNPPFRRGMDIKHIDKAFSLVKPGGVLVALCYAGPRQQRAYAERTEHWELLPAETFRDTGTGAVAALMVLRQK